jgi:hypothetical protein
MRGKQGDSNAQGPTTRQPRSKETKATQEDPRSGFVFCCAAPGGAAVRQEKVTALPTRPRGVLDAGLLQIRAIADHDMQATTDKTAVEFSDVGGPLPAGTRLMQVDADRIVGLEFVGD